MTETERVSNEAANDRSDADRISSGAIDPSDLGTGATGIIETNTTISESDDALMHNNEARSFGSVSSRGIDEWNCCCPHGLYVLIPSILATMGWFARLTQVSYLLFQHTYIVRTTIFHNELKKIQRMDVTTLA